MERWEKRTEGISTNENKEVGDLIKE